MSRSAHSSFYGKLGKFSWKEISDPIYSYVYFNREVEEEVINHVLLQRLRYIMQLQTAHLVYPGAVHTRFQHSLGVMHLSSLMAEDVLSKVQEYYGPEHLEGYSVDSLVQGLRLAALLHDIGHACFGHAFEEAVLFDKELPEEVANHERIGYKLYEVMLRDRVHRFEKEHGLDHLDEIVSKILSRDLPREKIIALLRWTLRDSLYPADILDYLLRDSYYTGTREYGYIDYNRLYKNTYPYVDDKFALLMLDRNTWGVFRAYLYAKASMYEHVYYHSVNRAFDRLLKEILELLDQELDFAGRVLKVARGEPEEYLLLTDALMYSIMLSKALSREGRVSSLARRLLIERKPEWKRVGREYILGNYRGVYAVKYILRLTFDREYRREVERSLLERLYDALKGHNVDISDLWVDILDISPVPESALLPGKVIGSAGQVLTLFMCKRSGSKIVRDREIRLIEEGLPLMIIFRAYIRRDKYDPSYETIATQAIKSAVEDELKLSGYEREYEKIVSEVYSGISSREYAARVTK